MSTKGEPYGRRDDDFDTEALDRELADLEQWRREVYRLADLELGNAVDLLQSFLDGDAERFHLVAGGPEERLLAAQVVLTIEVARSLGVRPVILFDRLPGIRRRLLRSRSGRSR